MEEFDAYALPVPNTTDYGDDYFDANLLVGATVEVTQAPTKGTLNLSNVPNWWSFTANANASGQDVWKWRPVLNGVPGDEKAVTMNVNFDR